MGSRFEHTEIARLRNKCIAIFCSIQGQQHKFTLHKDFACLAVVM